MRYSGIKRLAVFVLLTVTGTVAVACGGSDKAPPLSIGDNGSGGGSGIGGRTGRAGAAGKETDGGEDGGNVGPGGGADGGVLAPVVSITSPDPSDDPNVGPVLSSDVNKVSVVCKAVASTEPGAKPLDPASVTLEMLDASGKSLTSPPAIAKQSTQDTSEFSFDFVYTNVENGKVGFRCKAKDKAGNVGVATLETFVDHGPDLTPITPKQDSAHAANASINIEFQVSPHELASNDQGDAVSDVGLQINGAIMDLTHAEDPNKAGHYQLSISPTDQQNLGTALNGSVAIAISATNKRGVKKTSTYHFIVDGDPPVVAITTPSPLAIIGGKQLLSFTVTDTGSGVKQDSIVVTLNHDPHPIDLSSGLWTMNSGAYTFVIDASLISNATVQINVAVDATDQAGNSGGTTAIYYLDTTPPIVDLNVPSLQEVKVASSTSSFCSDRFDPLGNSAVGDWPDETSISTGFVRVRGLSWDEGNRLLGGAGQNVYFSGTDQRAGFNPKVYYAPGGSALLVDNDKDGICDDVDGVKFPFIDLHSVPPTGTSSYPAKQELAISSADCVAGSDSGPPPALCNGIIDVRDMTRVIQHEQHGGLPEPVIYTVDTNFCDNSPLQLATLQGITNGWVCLAMRSQDKVGNVGVSAPLRVCLNDIDPRDHAGPTPDCAKNMSVQPPSCTSGCKPPGHFYGHNLPPDPSYIIIPH